MAIDTLRHAAASGIKKDFHCDSEKGCQILKESGTDTKNASLSIRPGKGGVTVLTFDKSREKNCPDPIFPYFNESISGLCSKCDGIAIYVNDDKTWIVAIELKSKNFGKAREQLNAGVCFARFLASRLRLLVGRDVGEVMIGAALFAISPTPQKRANPASLNVRDIEGVRAAVVYDKAEVRVSELSQFLAENNLASPAIF